MEKMEPLMMRFDPETLEMLRRLAELDARVRGGRPNVSGTIRALVRREAAEKLPADEGRNA